MCLLLGSPQLFSTTKFPPKFKALIDSEDVCFIFKAFMIWPGFNQEKKNWRKTTHAKALFMLLLKVLGNRFDV